LAEFWLSVTVYEGIETSAPSLYSVFAVGETVDFGNDYVDTVEECIDGYAVQVLGYEVVDTRELYERYNMGQADEATVKNTPFYCLLKVRIYNKDCDLGEEGGLMLDRYSLMGDNYMALVSENVFCTMYPDMPGTSFSLRKGTSMRAVQKRICRKKHQCWKSLSFQIESY